MSREQGRRARGKETKKGGNRERAREREGEREGVWVVSRNLARSGAQELQYNVIISRLWGERVSRVIPYRLCTPNKTRVPENIT